MRKNVPNETKVNAILQLLGLLDQDNLEQLRNQRSTILLLAVPVSAAGQDEDDDWDDEDEWPDEPEDEDDDCPDFEPCGDGSGRCAYACPECGVCLRNHIMEEFE